MSSTVYSKISSSRMNAARFASEMKSLDMAMTSEMQAADKEYFDILQALQAKYLKRKSEIENKYSPVLREKMEAYVNENSPFSKGDYVTIKREEDEIPMTVKITNVWTMGTYDGIIRYEFYNKSTRKMDGFEEGDILIGVKR